MKPPERPPTAPATATQTATPTATARTPAATLATAGRYSLVGAACAVLNVAIVWLGHDVLGAPYVLAALATCVITIPLSYAAHRQFSFASSQPAGPEFLRFVVQQLSQFGLGLVLLVLLVEVAGLPPTPGMAAVTALMVVYGFVTNGRWVFRAFGRR